MGEQAKETVEGNPVSLVDDVDEDGRVEAASAALRFGDDDDDAVDDETDEQPPAKEPPTEEPKEPKADDPPEPPKSDDGDPPGAAWKALRRRERDVREKEEALYAKLASEKAEVDRLKNLAMTDPDAYYLEIGRDPDEVFKVQTRKRLQQEEPDEPEYVKEMRREIASIKEERVRERQTQQQQQAKSQFSRQVNYFADQAEDGVVQFPSEGGNFIQKELKDVAPSFARLPPDLRRARMESAAAYIIRNDPDMPFDECLKALDTVARREVDHIVSGNGQPGVEPPKPVGRGARSNPEQDKVQRKPPDEPPQAPQAFLNEEDEHAARIARAMEALKFE